MGKRKYPKVSGFWVYTIYIPSVNKYYIGYSCCKKCNERWKKSLYKGTALEPYIDEWDSMIKTVIQDGLTEEEAVKLEDKLIVKYRNENRCVNQYRSGWIKKNNENAYHIELYKTNEELKEKRNKKARERYHKNKQIDEWVKEYNKKAREYRENNREHRRKYQREYNRKYKAKNREELNRKRRERRAKKKLEQQQNQNQLTLFDLAS